ncbi:hypothetical protein GW17_00054069 [Ensete ventricosum]|nr:hypothetical protein GW17_00054069 [Ensete ventricosum]
MRLNCIESFYAFLSCFLSEGSEKEGQPATASPHTGLATHGQTDCKGQSVAAKGPYKGAADHDQSPLQGQPPAG